MVTERADAGEKEPALTDPEKSGEVQKETVFQAEQHFRHIMRDG